MLMIIAAYRPFRRACIYTCIHDV